MKLELDWGTGWQDVSAYVEKKSILRTLAIHKNLSPTINTFKAKIIKNTTLINSILTATVIFVRAFEDDEETYYFSGMVNNNFKVKIDTSVDGIELECVDLAWTLKEELESSLCWENHKVMDSANQSNSIVHKLLALISFPTAGISAQSIDKTVEYFMAAPGETLEDILKNLLANYSHVYNFEVDGSFKVYPIVQATMATSHVFDNENMIGTAEIQKNEARAKSMTVNYRPVIHEIGRIVASDTTGGNAVYKANIQVAPGDYYPIDSDTKDIKMEFKYNEFELIRVANPSMDLSAQTGVVLRKFIPEDLSAVIGIENTAASLRYIQKLDIIGDPYYYGDYNSQYVHNGEATDKSEDMEAKYIGNDLAAAALAQARASYWKYADYSYSIKSKTKIPMGEFCTLSDNTLGIITTCQVIERKDKGDGYYDYSLIGASAFSLLPDTGGEAIHTTTPPVQDVPLGDIVGTIAEGFDYESGGIVYGSTTPTIPVLECVPIPGGIRLTVDVQPSLKYLDHYEFQVSDDGVTWYPLGYDGTDWKTGPSGGVTTYPRESFLHTNLPPVQLSVFGDLVSGSDEVTISAGTARLGKGDKIEGTGIPAGLKIDEVIDGTTIRMTAAATATGENVSLLIGDDITGTGDNKKYMGISLYYRANRVTLAGAISDWSTPVICQAGQINPGDIPANSIIANQLVANFLETGYANIGYSMVIGFSGVGTASNPQDGDRRIYLDGDEISFQQFFNNSWTNNDALRIGGTDLDGYFNKILSAKGISHPSNEPESQEFYPGGDLFDFEDGFTSNTGYTPAVVDMGVISGGKFGGNAAISTTTGWLNFGMINFASDIDVSFLVDFFVGFYIKPLLPDDGTSNHVFFWERGGAGSTQLYLRLSSNGDLTLIQDSTVGDPEIQLTGLSIPNDGEWHFIAIQQKMITGNQTKLNLLLDNNLVSWTGPRAIYGELCPDGYGHVNFPPTDSTTLYIMDELFIFNGSIDIEVLRTHYLKGIPWNSKYSEQDLIVKPQAGGEFVIDGSVRITGEITAPGLGGLPIGFIYTQYPGEADPATLGLDGIWSNISSTYAGLFFRAEGGAAGAFNAATQGYYMGSHNHQWFDYNSSYDTASGALYTGSNSFRVRSYNSSGSSIKTSFYGDYYTSNKSTGTNETRPVNKTIRIWKKTA